MGIDVSRHPYMNHLNDEYGSLQPQVIPNQVLPAHKDKKCQMPTCFKSQINKYKPLLLSRAMKIKDKPTVVHLYHGIPLSNKLLVQKHEQVSKTVCWTKKGWQKYKLYYFIYEKYNNRQNSSIVVNVTAKKKRDGLELFQGVMEIFYILF